ncbi:MAG: PIN domain-containing protein [Candidatus Micrarchaeota archaeon]
MAILIDTGVWIGYSNQRDQYYQTALNIMKDINSGKYGSIFSTDYIIAEAVNYSLVKYSTEKSLHIGETMINTTELIHSNQDIFDRSWLLYKQDKQGNPEKPLSFTDSTIIVTAKMLGIRYIASFDARFKKYVEVVDY